VVPGNWYEPLKKLRSYASVIHAEHLNTTSSAGDWDGFFVQRIGSMKYYVIRFFQENNFPKDGFIVTTSEVEMTFDGEINRDIVDQIIEQLNFET